ncbi:MAG: hypothetical protein WC865_17750 [Bacteroidales bacterium]
MKTLACRYLLISLSLLAVSAPAQMLDKRLDKIESAIKDSVKTNEKEKDTPDAGQDAVQSNQAALQTYSKYDFIPGEKVIFYDDFSQDNIGDFPALWNTNASGEVVNTLPIMTPMVKERIH